MEYTLKELIKLRDIRAKGFDSENMDDSYDSAYGFFVHETTLFFEWLNKMEEKGRVKYLLLNTVALDEMKTKLNK